MTDQEIIDTCEQLYKKVRKLGREIGCGDTPQDATPLGWCVRFRVRSRVSAGDYIVQASAARLEQNRVLCDTEMKICRIVITRKEEVMFIAEEHGEGSKTYFGVAEHHLGTKYFDGKPWVIKFGSIPTELLKEETLFEGI